MLRRTPEKVAVLSFDRLVEVLELQLVNEVLMTLALVIESSSVSLRFDQSWPSIGELSRCVACDTHSGRGLLLRRIILEEKWSLCGASC